MHLKRMQKTGTLLKLRAKTTLRCDLETLWAHTQDPGTHARWDLRFTEIHPLPSVGHLARFSYLTRIGFGREIGGWGESRTSTTEGRSVLRFGSDDPLSLIREGAGYWAYSLEGATCSLETSFDYGTRGGLPGRCLDTAVFRPLMLWATRWSFDRLRLWIERGLDPEVSLRIWIVKVTCRMALGIVWCIEGLVPKILFVSPGEESLVAASGLVLGTPRLTLNVLGGLEILAGLWLLSGKRERESALAAGMAMVALAGLVAVLEPGRLADPLGGLSKNLGLLACAAAVWALEPLAPRAERGRG